MKSSRKTSLATEWLSKAEAELQRNAEFGSRRQEIIESRPFGISKHKTTIQRIEFEDTYLAMPGKSLIQSCPLRRIAVRIFDNIVERASREMMQNLV